MKRFNLILLFVIAVGFAAWSGMDNEQQPPAPPAVEPKLESFKVDPVHSKALFRVQHLGAGRFYGRFNDVQGTIKFDGNENAAFDVTIAAASVDTGNPQLDGHLKSPDFFNAKENPTLSFKGKTAAKTSGRNFGVNGDLTIHGVTKSVAMEIEWTGTADKGHGRRCGFEAVFTLNRSDYGMKYGVAEGTLGDEVKVIVSLEGTAE